jgi:MHS family proline/betaine transporter-like MFS transporter
MTISPKTRVVLAGAIGNIVEWYDFGLYGLLAPVLASLFFPSNDRLAALLGVYGGFAVGFAIRPIGAVILGRVGDRKGRQFVLVLSVALMGVATVALGVLPSYHAIGLWAPILLIGIRLFQGFSVGGEFVGSVTYLVETAPAQRRGVAGSVANIGATIGMLIAAAGAALAETYASSFPQVWRIPFLFGGALAFAGYWLRRHLPPEQTEIESTSSPVVDESRSVSCDAIAVAAARVSRFGKLTQRWPALRAFREAPGTMLVATLFTCGYGVSNYVIMVFLPTFGREFADISEATALRINTAGQFVALIVVPLAGWVSDLWIRRRTMLSGAFLLQALVAWELFDLVLRKNTAGLWIAQLLLASLLAIVMGTAPAMLAEQFPRGYRVSGHAVVLNVGIGIAGGTAPMIAVALIRGMGSSMAPAVYLAAACMVSVISVLLLREHSRLALPTL